MHQVINDEILTILRTILNNIEVQNKENGKDYSEDVKNPEGKEVIVEREHEELYKDLISFRELFVYKNEERNNYTYKNEAGKELGIYLPKIVDGEKNDVLAKITERFDAIESKFNKLTFTDNDKKQNIKNQLDNYKAILSEKNKERINENITTKTNEGPEQNEPQTPAPTNEQQSIDRRRKVVKRETFGEKIYGATLGRLDAIGNDDFWEKKKQQICTTALNATIKAKPFLFAGALGFVGVAAVKVIAGTGGVIAAGEAASLLAIAPPLAGFALTTFALAFYIRKARKIKKDREKADEEEKEREKTKQENKEQSKNNEESKENNKENENKNSPKPQQPKSDSGKTDEPAKNSQNNEPEVKVNNPKISSPNEEPPIATNNPVKEAQEQDVLVQLRDKKQQVIETKAAMEIEKQKDSSDPIVKISQELATTRHEKSKHEFVKIILENIDVQELEQEESHSMTM